MLELDAEYLIPINIKTYSYDVVQAARSGSPIWSLLHDYLEYYGLDDLRPDHIHQQIALKLRDKEPAATKYIWDQSRRVGEQPT